MHGDLLLRNNRCFISPSRSRKTMTVCSLGSSRSDINSSKCLAHSSLCIIRSQRLVRLWNILASTPNCHVCSFRLNARESGCEAFDQNVAVEGLGQETDCSRLQRSRATDLNGKSRDENERHAMSLGAQMGLQFDTGHRRHSNVCNHARRFMQTTRLQELYGRRKWMDDVPDRPHEVAGRGTNGFIIIDDRDYRRLGHSGLS